MAAHSPPIFGFGTVPDSSGSVFLEPKSVKDTNDLVPRLVWVFNDTSTKISLLGGFRVPDNYVGTAQLVIRWDTTATAGNVQWDFDYRAIADGESSDPTTFQESVNSGAVAVPGTALLEKETTLNLTSANFAPGDQVEFVLSRGGDSANDTAAAAVRIIGASFKYQDV